MSVSEIVSQAARTVAEEVLSSCVALTRLLETLKENATASAASALASAETVEQRKAEIEVVISANVPGHEWDGTQLRLKNPDGAWGVPVDLKGAVGATGPTALMVHEAPTGFGTPAILHLRPISDGSSLMTFSIEVQNG